MSHYASGPNFGFPRGDARLDITDLYAFNKPGDSAKSIIVLNVHPPFRLDSPELLPGILSYNSHKPVRFPDNGRKLTDDVVDIFLPIYTNGKVTEDKVGPHRDLLDEFPYLRVPHE
jgi:hypothetical protein